MKVQVSNRTFAELESVIQQGKQTFVDVGLALAEMRDRELYKPYGYTTFEDYCRGRWGWEKRYWQYVIKAAATVEQLPEDTRTIVRTETQARELSKVEPEHREEVIQAAAEKAESEDRPMTALDVRVAAVEVCKPEPVEPPAPAAQPDRKSDDTFCFCVELEELTQRATGTGTPKQLRAYLLELTKCSLHVRVALKNR